MKIKITDKIDTMRRDFDNLFPRSRFASKERENMDVLSADDKSFDQRIKKLQY